MRASVSRLYITALIVIFPIFFAGIFMGGCQPSRVEIPPPIQKKLQLPPDTPGAAGGVATATREEFTQLVKLYEAALQEETKAVEQQAQSAREEAVRLAEIKATETARAVSKSKRQHERALASLVDEQLAELESIADSGRDSQIAIERAAQVQLARYAAQVQQIRADADRSTAAIAAAIAEADRKDAQRIAIANVISDIADAATSSGVGGPLALITAVAGLGVGWLGLKRPGDVPKPVADLAVKEQDRYREAARGLAAAFHFLPTDLRDRLEKAGLPPAAINEILSRVGAKVNEQLTPEDKMLADRLAREDGIAVPA